MRRARIAIVLLSCVGPFTLACGAREDARPAAQEKAPPPAAVAAEATPAPPAPTAPEEPPALVTVAESPTVSPKPAVPEAAPAPVRPKPPVQAAPTTPAKPVGNPSTPAPAASSASEVVDPGGEIAVPPAKSGLERVGAGKCKLCHKVQYTSWAASAHARRTPPLDCESCHGPGNEYRALSVMKDPEKAKAAGLVMPGADFCARCHKGPWDPALLGKAHAHKTAS